jgi:hypothetical protein
MKKLALVALTAGAVIGIVGGASAQGFYFGFGTEPSYAPDPYYGPDPYYAPRPYYREYQPRYYYEPRYYPVEPRHTYGEPQYYRPGRYRTWNGCQGGYTVQDGLCKPYRGY